MSTISLATTLSEQLPHTYTSFLKELEEAEKRLAILKEVEKKFLDYLPADGPTFEAKILRFDSERPEANASHSDLEQCILSVEQKAGWKGLPSVYVKVADDLYVSVSEEDVPKPHKVSFQHTGVANGEKFQTVRTWNETYLSWKENSNN